MTQMLDRVGADSSSNFNIQAFIDVTLLKCNLKGVYQYEVIPGEGEGKPDEKKTKVLVMPTDAEPKSMTLVELMKEINDIINSFGGGKTLTEEDLKETLDSMGLGVIKNISVQIRQLFIYVDHSSNPDNPKNCEYAFNFVVLNEVNPDESLKLFNIKSLGLAVYNTKRKKIIERMQLENIEELLA